MAKEQWGAEPASEESIQYMTCPRCGGSGIEHWYLGDEFNSQGYSECDICDGTGVCEI